MNARLLAKLLKPPVSLPAPDPQCRQIIGDGALLLLFRNHERQFEQSRNLHAPTDTHSTDKRGGRVVPLHPNRS